MIAPLVVPPLQNLVSVVALRPSEILVAALAAVGARPDGRRRTTGDTRAVNPLRPSAGATAAGGRDWLDRRDDPPAMRRRSSEARRGAWCGPRLRSHREYCIVGTTWSRQCSGHR
ncbi:MAG: hypothetical protein J2P22_10470, partial [Nocardioides sp.]|nr:hypothetical protein [Nocardioides sp.]